MPERMPPDDDPIIRALREQGVRPLSLGRGRGGGARPTVRRGLLLAIVIAVILLTLIPAISNRFSDWLWYDDVGFERVFFTKIVAQWTLGLIGGVIAFVTLYVNARLALRDDDTVGQPIIGRIMESAKLSRGAQAMLERGAGFVALVAAGFVALLFALGVATQWRTILQFVYRTPFGVTDPIFSRDVGYYVFTLPMIELATGGAVLLVGI